MWFSLVIFRFSSFICFALNYQTFMCFMILDLKSIILLIFVILAWSYIVLLIFIILLWFSQIFMICITLAWNSKIFIIFWILALEFLDFHDLSRFSIGIIRCSMIFMILNENSMTLLTSMDLAWTSMIIIIY